MKLRRTIGLALVFCGVLAAQDLTLDQILQKHYTSMGGLEKIKAINSMSMTAKMVMGGGQMEAPMTMKMKRPHMMRSDVSIQGKTFVRATDGTTAWQINPFTGGDEPQKLSGSEADQLNDNADLDGALVDYKSRGIAVELIGKEDVEGSPAYRLKVTRKGGRLETFWLDGTTFLTVKSTTKITQMGQELDVESFPSNYRKADGVMVPYSLEQKVNGRSMVQMTVEKVESNVALDDAIFKMPSPAPKPAERKPQ
jgi:outer membrane lipoprotein-sorting protein